MSYVMPNLLPDVGDPSLFTKQDAGDESLFVVFYMGVIPDDAQTIEQGRPIFRDIECCRITVPGDRNNVIDRPATQRDKQRFAKSYLQFQAGKKEEEQISGTLLNVWPFLTRAQCEEFRYLGVRTVEQLAELRDDTCAKNPGFTQLKQHAHLWLERARDGAEVSKTAQRLADQDRRIEELGEVIKDQAARIQKLLMAQPAKE